MSQFYSEIEPALQEFIAQQQMFFTASATATSRVNVSPKGIDSFRVLDPNTVAYLDLTGSGSETSAHLLDDGRMTIMFCSFAGSPLILRLYGTGEQVHLNSPRGQQLHELFPSLPGERHIIVLRVESVQTSCGFAVPLYEFQQQRDLLINWADTQGEEKLKEYRHKKNSVSIDGLPTGLGD